MTFVMVERSFEAPADFDSLQQREIDGAWCLDQHGVCFLRTYFSRDKLRMLCLYEAPDAESVRVSQRTVGMPVERVWAASELGGEDAPATVVVERDLPQPATLDDLRAMDQKSRWCFEMYGIRRVTSYVASGGRHMVCAFAAPDAESLRTANRTAELPVTRIWSATIHTP